MMTTTTTTTTRTTTTDGSGDHHHPRRKRRSRRTEAVRFGDDDRALAREHYFWFDEENDKASWDEIYQSCCVHSAEDWGWLCVGLICLAICLYLALLGFHLLGDSAQILFGCRASALFDRSVRCIALRGVALPFYKCVRERMCERAHASAPWGFVFFEKKLTC